eukprot:CAMPEP_0172163710 /NCGR_PEP_ID=MMETSP1050-20130122/7423_1 /TAXON_ID=233186 /ORGANISM="Cryptomonas curvata, Strain CCAP979/52" /LENGTH=127 /DNA_ID=CAMNT_0012833931 /DNA_START=231 /DNA_END=611 /DNA_ORIENTATION=-
MSNVQGIASQDDLSNIIKLASSPLPNRPDGTVVCVMYSSVDDWGCQSYDGEFDRLSLRHPDCVFLRCYKEYRGADSLLTARQVSSVSLPAFEVFYGGNTVARVGGPQLNQVEQYIRQFGFAVSTTDL